MSRIGLARRIAYYLAEDPLPWPTLGDLVKALNVHAGTAIGERLREARVYYGFDIRHYCFMPKAERERVRKTDGYKAARSSRRRAA